MSAYANHLIPIAIALTDEGMIAQLYSAFPVLSIAKTPILIMIM